MTFREYEVLKKYREKINKYPGVLELLTPEEIMTINSIISYRTIDKINDSQTLMEQYLFLNEISKELVNERKGVLANQKDKKFSQTRQTIITSYDKEKTPLVYNPVVVQNSRQRNLLNGVLIKKLESSVELIKEDETLKILKTYRVKLADDLYKVSQDKVDVSVLELNTVKTLLVAARAAELASLLEEGTISLDYYNKTNPNISEKTLYALYAYKKLCSNEDEKLEDWILSKYEEDNSFTQNIPFENNGRLIDARYEREYEDKKYTPVKYIRYNNYIK